MRSRAVCRRLAYFLTLAARAPRDRCKCARTRKSPRSMRWCGPRVLARRTAPFFLRRLRHDVTGAPDRDRRDVGRAGGRQKRRPLGRLASSSTVFDCKSRYIGSAAEDGRGRDHFETGRPVRRINGYTQGPGRVPHFHMHLPPGTTSL